MTISVAPRRGHALPTPHAVAAGPVPVERALAALLSRVDPIAPHRLATADAAGLVLAEALVAGAPFPSTRTALRAGWAIRAADTVGASSYSPVPLAAATSVAAGASLPDGCDAVLTADAVTIDRDGSLQAHESAAPGLWTRRVGEDAAAGRVLREAGCRLSALDVAIARAIGIAEVAVRQPRLRLLALGRLDDELEACLGLCGSFAQSRGARVDGPHLLDKLAGHDLRADDAQLTIVVTSPQSDAGAVLGSAGASVVAGSLALRPGESTMVALSGERPVVAIRATIADTVGAWLAVVGPVLDHMAGARPTPRPPRPLTRKIASTIGLVEIALLREAPDGFEPVATSDLTLAALARADHYICVPPGHEGYPAGSRLGAERL